MISMFAHSQTTSVYSCHNTAAKMAAAFGRTQLEIEKTSTSVTVPDDLRARLMFYFSCVLSLIDDDDDDLDTVAIRRIKDYKNYQRLSNDEVDMLVATCDKLEPKEMLRKGLFVLKGWSGSRNEFYKIRATRNQMILTSNVLVGGVRHSVTEQMHCSAGWIEKNYNEPMTFFRQRLARLRRQQMSNRVVIVANDCVVM